MARSNNRVGIHPLWWTAALFVTVIGLVVTCSLIFAGTFRRYVPVTLTSDRSGLVMESGAKVKMSGVVVGRVAGIAGGKGAAALKLELDPDKVGYIPANVEAEIATTTAFGAKYVDLIYPDQPSAQRLAAGAVLKSRNVATEVNTVFDNLVGLLNQIDVAKLSGVLTAVADGVRGQGERIGQATTDANEVLLAVNPRMDRVGENWRSLRGVSEAYSSAASDILDTLAAATVTGETIIGHEQDLDALLLSAIGFSTSGTDLIAPNRDNLINGINVLEPTTSLLLKYDPIYTCLLQGAKYALDNGAYENIGGNGRSVVQDVGLLMGDDPYRYPQHLPKVAAKGGPGGQPGCGSLPDVSKNFPVRHLVTDTGFGTGLDIRPNPGIGFPGWANYYPVTKAVPEPPRVRHFGGPAPGPAPAVPGGAPYGAALYGPDGTPLWPGVPPPPPAAPAAPAAPLPAEAPVAQSVPGPTGTAP